MKFYEFSQNNSGGSFECNESLTHRVLIEAQDSDEANRIAESLGMYWDGVEEGMDCPCCGNRWSPVSSGDEIVFPYRYGRFTLDEAKSIAEKLGGEVVDGKKSKFNLGNRTHDVMLPTPESYMQYCANAYGGWTNPDGYIHYKDGRKVSVFRQKNK